MNRERKDFDINWNQQRVENHRLNEALFQGWKDGQFYRGAVSARRVLKDILHPQKDKETI